MSKKKPTEAEMQSLEDAALARIFHDNYESLAPEFGYETREETRQFDPESKNGKLMIAVAGKIRSQVIDPAVIAGAGQILKAHRDGLYESIPEGDLDAMTLFNIIQNHIGTLDAAIKSLQRAVTPEAEVVNEDK